MNFLVHGSTYPLIVMLLPVFSLSAFVVGLIYKKRHKEINHLFIYALASSIQNIIAIFLDGKNILNLSIINTINPVIIHIFIVVEFICIYLFFSKTEIITGFVKKIFSVLFVVFLCLYIWKWVTKDDFLRKSGDIYFLDSCFILLPCFIYLFRLFIIPPTLNLLNEPSFWFNTGILIYFTLTFPVFLMADYFRPAPIHMIMNDVNIIGYCIVFSFLIRAYLCKPKLIYETR